MGHAYIGEGCSQGTGQNTVDRRLTWETLPRGAVTHPPESGIQGGPWDQCTAVARRARSHLTCRCRVWRRHWSDTHERIRFLLAPLGFWVDEFLSDRMMACALSNRRSICNTRCTRAAPGYGASDAMWSPPRRLLGRTWQAIQADPHIRRFGLRYCGFAHQPLPSSAAGRFRYRPGVGLHFVPLARTLGFRFTTRWVRLRKICQCSDPDSAGFTAANASQRSSCPE